jgi:hypothetical protein
MLRDVNKQYKSLNENYGNLYYVQLNLMLIQPYIESLQSSHTSLKQEYEAATVIKSNDEGDNSTTGTCDIFEASTTDA